MISAAVLMCVLSLIGCVIVAVVCIVVKSYELAHRVLKRSVQLTTATLIMLTVYILFNQRDLLNPALVAWAAFALWRFCAYAIIKRRFGN